MSNSKPINAILEPNDSRFVIFPLKYEKFYNMYKKAEAMIWSDDEIDFSLDAIQWKKIAPEDQKFLKHILGFFAAADGIVMENLAVRFFSEVQIPELRSIYALQMHIENVHSITYSKIIDTIIQDPRERDDLFNAIQTMSGVQKKARWAQKWINSSDSFAVRVIAFVIVEGLFFSGSFSGLIWLRCTYPGLMSGTIQANELIMRDEGFHQETGVAVFDLLLSMGEFISQELFNEIMTEAVDTEIAFMSDALPNKLLGMNIELMSEHIKYVANRIAKQLHFLEIYPDARQPFEFMTNLSISTVADFFGPSKETQYNIGDKFMGVPLELKEDDVF